MTFSSYLRGGLALLIAPILVFICIWAILISYYIFGQSAKHCRKYPGYVSRLICFFAGVKVRIEGIDKIKTDQLYIYTGNHVSQFDIFSFHGYFPCPAIGLGKQELFAIPIFGHALRCLGHIPINRKGGKEAMKNLNRAAERIRKGALSVLIFPEGTRSVDGNLLPFKEGAMLMAIKAGVPLVPIAFIGSHSILPKNRLLPKSGTIIIRVGKPIETQGLAAKERHILANRVQNAVAALLTPTVNT